MSHISCPLCGKNVALSTFSPSELDLDLYLLSYRSLGRKGFKPTEKVSILGDDHLSPIVADRILNLANMFLKKRVFTPHSVIERLALEEILEQLPKFQAVLSALVDTTNRLKKENLRATNLESRNRRLSLNLEEKEKELNLHRRVDSILCRILENCETKIMLGDNEPWNLVVLDLDFDGFEVLEEISDNLGDEERAGLKKRLWAGTDQMDSILKELLWKKRKKKTIADFLMEFDISKIRYNKRNQNRGVRFEPIPD